MLMSVAVILYPLIRQVMLFIADSYVFSANSKSYD